MGTRWPQHPLEGYQRDPLRGASTVGASLLSWGLWDPRKQARGSWSHQPSKSPITAGDSFGEGDGA